MEVLPAGLGSGLPEGPVLLVGPQGEQLVEMGQVVGGVGEILLRHKADELVLRVPHGPPCAGGFPLVDAVVEKLSGLLGIGEDALPIAPPVGSEKQRHGEVLLPVRGGAPGVFGAVCLAGPGKVAGVLPLCHVHVGLGPLPNAVELLFSVHLHAHHHAVGHALGAGVVVAGVLQVAHVLPGGVVEPLVLRAVEDGLEGLLHLAVDVLLGIAALGEQVAVFLGGKRSLHVVNTPSLREACFGGFHLVHYRPYRADCQIGKGPPRKAAALFRKTWFIPLGRSPCQSSSGCWPPGRGWCCPWGPAGRRRGR